MCATDKAVATRSREEDMFVTIVDNRIYVRLSRRNLRQLDAILDRRDARNMGLALKDENGVSLVVQAEEDSDHYERRAPGPG
jgi:hypothetical protein